jgi:hypothetical protein
VLQALDSDAFTDSELVHEVDRVLFKQAGTDSVLNVVSAAVFQHHRLDPVAR